MGEKGPWHRDEFILVLELYQRNLDLDDDSPEVIEVSQVLRSLPINLDARGPKYRSPASVKRRLLNFAKLDGKSGLSGGGEECKRFWAQFHNKPAAISELAHAIRATATSVSASPVVEEETALEGAILTRMHVTFERDFKLARRRKEKALAETGRLACEACGFDFRAVYGPRGDGYIECHHKVPLSRLRASTRRRLQDLALLCANCHRMIHRTPLLSVDALRATIVQHSSSA